jgi:hypothetical protein
VEIEKIYLPKELQAAIAPAKARRRAPHGTRVTAFRYSGVEARMTEMKIYSDGLAGARRRSLARARMLDKSKKLKPVRSVTFESPAEMARMLSEASQVSRRDYDRFVALLDAPPQPNERLRKLMQTPAPWEQQKKSE